MVVAAVIDGCETQGIAERSQIAICNSRGLDLSCENILTALVVGALVTDGKEMADAYDINYMRIDTMEQCNETLAEVLTSKEGWLIDFRIDANADVYPMVPAGKGLDDILVGE